MGTWDFGPFDNDTAADWCGDLDDAPSGERIGRIRQALAAAADEQDYLDSREACQAIAAAAIVASTLPGGEPITTPYAPDFLLEGEILDLPADLAALSVRALDRVMADESEWWELWNETAPGEDNEAFASVRQLRVVLAGGAG